MDEDSGDHTHAGKLRRSNPDYVETFEAEGQLPASPGPGENGPDSESGLEQLRQVCSRLGVGNHGYLTKRELGQVCQFIGMEQMDDEELEELFIKLDVDHDGFISFDEFVKGLSHHTTTSTSITSQGYKTPSIRPLSGRKARIPLPPAQQDWRSAAVYTSVGSVALFSSLPSGTSGFATGEEITDYWERLNVPNGTDVLVSLGFDPQTKIQLKELSYALSTEWSEQMTEANSLSQALTATYQQELIYLRSGLDQTTQERNKLRSDLADALSRNALMATEVDERHAQLEKTHAAHLESLEQEYQEQLRQSQTDLKKEREVLSSQTALLKQTSEQLQGLQQQVANLKDRLAEAESEISIAHKELTQAKDKQADWEKQCNKLNKELELQQKQLQPDSPGSLSLEQEKQVLMEKIERYAAENKELKDHNDELVVQLEDLQHQIATGNRRGSVGSQGRSASMSRIPVRTSFSSDTSEWDDEDSSAEALYHSLRNQPAREGETEKTPSLSVELEEEQRQAEGQRRGRERKSLRHGGKSSEVTKSEGSESQLSPHNLEKEKKQMWQTFQKELSQKLAEQRRELQGAFVREKEEILQQFESRQSLRLIQHKEEIEALEDKLRQTEKQVKADNTQDGGFNLYSRNRVLELEKAKAELEDQLHHLKEHYETELKSLRSKYDDDLAKLKGSRDERLRAAVGKIFQQGARGLRGKLKEDFDRLVHQHRLDSTADSASMEKEEMYATFEREKMSLIQDYDSQILALQEELNNLRQDFEAERSAFHQMQSGELAQSIRQELQEEAGNPIDPVRQGWEEERRELVVQNQLLEEELADVKGILVQERQRSAEAHSLREHVRRLKSEYKEVQILAESLKEKVARSHQQQDLERSNFERRIDELEREKDKALRVQALKHAGSIMQSSVKEEEELQREILEQVIHEVEATRSHSPEEPVMEEGTLDQLQGQIIQMNHQLQEARTAQFEFQQLKDECELLKQTNANLEDMIRLLKQRSDKELVEREREEQDQQHDLWEEKKKLQNMLQRTTDKLLKTSAELAAGQTQMVREVEQLKQKAANMVELEVFTGLQVSLLETQRHSISLQEALMQRTQLADRIMAETDKERRHERDAWEVQRREIQCQLDASTEMYRNLALQHKALRQSSTKLATQMKDLYLENADLMNVLQQTESRQIAAQRRCLKLQEECQAWHGAVHRILDKNHEHENW